MTKVATCADCGRQEEATSHCTAFPDVTLPWGWRAIYGGAKCMNCPPKESIMYEVQLQNVPDIVDSEAYGKGYEKGFADAKRSYEDALILRGWFCKNCKIFNGEEKEKRVDCRSCGVSKKP